MELENSLNKFLPLLLAGLVAGSLSMGVFAEDAVKSSTALVVNKAAPAKLVSATTANKPVAVKKETGFVAKLKNLLPHAKDAAKK